MGEKKPRCANLGPGSSVCGPFSLDVWVRVNFLFFFFIKGCSPFNFFKKNKQVVHCLLTQFQATKKGHRKFRP